MSKKGTSNYERELSQQELSLLETQNQMMQQGVNIAQTAEDRSQKHDQQWQNTYLPIETGMIPRGATRETGYRVPQQSSALFQGTRQRPTGRPVSLPNALSQAMTNSARTAGKGA